MFRLITSVSGLAAMLVAFAAQSAAVVVAQETRLDLSPTSGPCDAAVEVRGQGFPPAGQVEISILRPHSEGPYARLGEVSTDALGALAASFSLGAAGCEVAARDDAADDPSEPKELFIWADALESPVAKVARYTYTTTTIEGATVGPAASQTASVAPPTSTNLPTPGTSGAADGSDESGSDRTNGLMVGLAVGATALVMAIGSYLVWRLRRRVR